jgi:hypothetical protein
VRDLDEKSGAVAGFRVAAARAAVGKVDQDLDPLHDDVMRLLAVDPGHKADAASIMLMPGMVESLGTGQTSDNGVVHPGLLHVHILNNITRSHCSCKCTKPGSRPPGPGL